MMRELIFCAGLVVLDASLSDDISDPGGQDNFRKHD
jgi:hypothetical protein